MKDALGFDASDTLVSFKAMAAINCKQEPRQTNWDLKWISQEMPLLVTIAVTHPDGQVEVVRAVVGGVDAAKKLTTAWFALRYGRGKLMGGSGMIRIQ